jgi:hypothetical protein
MELIPPFLLDCVVAIGLIVSASDGTSKQWVASGFLYGEITKQASKVEDNEYRVFLVTQ